MNRIKSKTGITNRNRCGIIIMNRNRNRSRTRIMNRN